MGNQLPIENCCGERSDQTGVTFKAKKTPTLDHIIINYGFERLLSNCNGGIVENYICHSKKMFSYKDKKFLLSSIDMRSSVMSNAD